MGIPSGILTTGPTVHPGHLDLGVPLLHTSREMQVGHANPVLTPRGTGVADPGWAVASQGPEGEAAVLADEDGCYCDCGRSSRVRAEWGPFRSSESQGSCRHQSAHITHTSIYKHPRTHIITHTHRSLHTHTPTHTHTYATHNNAHVHIQTHICIHAHTYSYKHSQTCTHIHKHNKHMDTCPHPHAQVHVYIHIYIVCIYKSKCTHTHSP